MAKIHKGDHIETITRCEEHGDTAFIDGEEVKGLSINQLRRVKEGESIPSHGQLVWTDDEGQVTDTMDLGDKPKGPSRVSSKKYRDGYERVFGKEVN